MGKSRKRQLKKAVDSAIDTSGFAEAFSDYQDEIEVLKKVISIIVNSTGSEEMVCKIGPVRQMHLGIKDGYITIKLGGDLIEPLQEGEKENDKKN